MYLAVANPILEGRTTGGGGGECLTLSRPEVQFMEKASEIFEHAYADAVIV